jgi:hypothetical protein
MVKSSAAFVAVVAILCFGIRVLGQGSVDEYGGYRPTEEEIEHNKRILELWKHPTFVTLRLTSVRRDSQNEESSTTPSPYYSDERMDFLLFMTQNSTETLSITSSSGGSFRQYKPYLIRDGEVVLFSDEAQRNIKRAEAEVLSGSRIAKFLEPGHEYRVDRLSLDSWYDYPVRPGHYQLTIKRRFAFDGDWVESNPVTFDVVPRRTASPIPDKFSLRVAPAPPGQPPESQRYQLGYNDGLFVELVNDSDQRVPVSVVDEYYGHRPQLTKDGKVVPYSDEVARLIESKEKDTRLVEIVSVFFLDPKTKSRLDGFSLKQWYGPLGPGIYRLTDRRRFEIGGPWTKDSNELVFEIMP